MGRTIKDNEKQCPTALDTIISKLRLLSGDDAANVTGVSIGHPAGLRGIPMHAVNGRNDCGIDSGEFGS
jgi:hypothetical protein